MKGRTGSAPARATVNLLLALGAFITVFPLVWMVSVSFMAQGEASRFPPPLLPAATQDLVTPPR